MDLIESEEKLNIIRGLRVLILVLVDLIERQIKKSFVVMISVLILVLVDLIERRSKLILIILTSGLNPCFSGFDREIENKESELIELRS